MVRKKIKSMHEFAEACGVSRPTLSKYFNDPTSVKTITRTRIEAALKRTNFEPNHFARHFNRKRTRNVGILVPTMSDPFFAQAVSLIEMALRQEGFFPIRASSHREPQYEEDAVRMLSSMKVAGAIIAPLGERSTPSVFSRLTDTVPVVSFDSRIGADVPFVGNDNAQSVSKIVQYLCRSGEPPVFMEIPRINENATARLEGYINTMREEDREPCVVPCNTNPSWDYEREGYEQLSKALSNGGLPGKTVLCANDRFAFGAMAAAYEVGLKVGRGADCDIRIAGHDNHPLSQYTCPSLTTMSQNAEEIAARSVEILQANMTAREEDRTIPVEHVVLPAELLMRRSA